MSETEWVEQVASELRGLEWFKQGGLSLKTSLKLAYGCEILSYGTQSLSDKGSFHKSLG
jgi:hypothetical protein